MPATRRDRPVPYLIGLAIGLAALDAGLLALAWHVWAAPELGRIQVERKTSFARDPAPKLLTPRPAIAEADAVALSRPLFSPTRRPFQALPPPEPPPVVAAPPPPPAPLPAPDLAADGILLRGTERTAHLHKQGEDQGDWHRQGDVIEGWTVKTITSSGVTLALGDRQVVIELYPVSDAPP